MASSRCKVAAKVGQVGRRSNSFMYWCHTTHRKIESFASGNMLVRDRKLFTQSRSFVRSFVRSTRGNSSLIREAATCFVCLLTWVCFFFFFYLYKIVVRFCFKRRCKQQIESGRWTFMDSKEERESWSNLESEKLQVDRFRLARSGWSGSSQFTSRLLHDKWFGEPEHAHVEFGSSLTQKQKQKLKLKLRPRPTNLSPIEPPHGASNSSLQVDQWAEPLNHLNVVVIVNCLNVPLFGSSREPNRTEMRPHWWF